MVDPQELERAKQMVKADLRFLLTVRHEAIVPYQGGFVYPRKEIRSLLRSLKKHR